jgi:ABC-type antimicrobial peptide transport system permease subunit
LLPAVAVSRLLASQLVGVTTFDTATFGSTAMLLAVVSVVAAWLPARRAVRVDPIAVLRTE